MADGRERAEAPVALCASTPPSRRTILAVLAFFEPPPPPDPGDEPEFSEGPPWRGPPTNVVGASVPLAPLLLGKTDRAAVAVVGASAFPTGFKLFLTARVHPEEYTRLRRSGRDAFMHQGVRQFGPGGGLSDDLLRFGVQFADGRKATNLGRFPAHEEEPAGPTLVPRGGGGGPTAWNQSFWVWPLPPPGSLGLVCEWPGFGIPESRAEIDAELVLAAAQRAEILWPEQSSGGGAARLGGWSATS